MSWNCKFKIGDILESTENNGNIVIVRRVTNDSVDRYGIEAIKGEDVGDSWYNDDYLWSETTIETCYTRVGHENSPKQAVDVGYRHITGNLVQSRETGVYYTVIDTIQPEPICGLSGFYSRSAINHLVLQPLDACKPIETTPFTMIHYYEKEGYEKTILKIEW